MAILMKMLPPAMMLLIFCSCAVTIVLSMTVNIQNNSSYEDLQPIVLCNDGRPPPLITNRTFRIESDRVCVVFFAAGCSFDTAGRPVNCRTGGCVNGSCSLTNPPDAATTIGFDKGTINLLPDNGYNLPLTGIFEDRACKSFSFSCAIPPGNWPDCLGFDSDPSASFTCSNDQVILTLIVAN